MTHEHDFRAGEPEFSYLLNIFLLEGEPAEKIIKRKILCVMFPRDMYRVVP